MLGRLFKQQQLPVSTPHNGPGAQGPPKLATSTSNSYEDSYTREILYGLLCASQLRPHTFSRRRFRLVVSQDGGNLRSKQVLFDSADRHDTPASGSGCQLRTPLPLRPRSLLELRLASLMRSPTSPSEESAEQLSQTLSMLQFLRALVASKNILTSKLLHNVTELNEYMFGRGLPSSESHTATKVHLLPQFNSVHGSFQAVLVTKLFLIPDTLGIVPEQPHDPDPCWEPTPTFPVRESSYSFPLSLLAGQASSSPELAPSLTVSNKYTVNSRFALGIVIPFSQEQSVDDVLFQNWEVISHYLVILQKLVTKKLLSVIKYSTVNGMCPYIANRRISFPSELLQADSDLLRQVQKLFSLVHYNYNTPRLVNSYSMMKHSAYHASSRFNAFLVNWALEVISWLEFKDGRNIVSSTHSNFASNAHFHNSHPHHNPHVVTGFNEAEGTQSNTFLASLFAVLLPLRHLIADSLRGSSKPGTTKEITRILVMTGNSMVAKKLIFILNGLIPDIQFESCISDEDYKRSLKYADWNESHENDYITTTSSQETFFNHSHCASERPRRTVTPFSDPTATPGSIPETTDTHELSRTPDSDHTRLAQPIPIKKGHLTRSSIAGSSDDSLSISVSSQKGWEVPGKAVPAASVSFVEKPSIETTLNSTTQHIPIHGKPSMSTSSSIAHLSSSLNSSLSSSASNYSFSKIGSSFLDKWRNSFASGQTYLHEPHHYHHSEGSEHAISTDLQKRPSLQSLNSPSPVVEQEDFHWDAATSSTGKSRMRLSRAQSMLDVYNLTLATDDQPLRATEFPAVSLRRTRCALVVPLANDHARGLDEVNKDTVRKKCERVMNAKFSFKKMLEDTLEVSISNRKNEEKIYKQKPLMPNVAFVDEFRPEYAVQLCPVSLRLENQVMTAMKNDLLFYHNDCDYARVKSRSVMISLRAKEIKVVEMSVGDKAGKPRSASALAGWTAPSPAFSHGQSTPPVTSHSPTTSYFQDHHTSIHSNGGHGLVDDSARGASYKTTIRKVFTPHRSSGDKELTNRIELLLDALTEVVAKINSCKNDGASQEPLKSLNSRLFATVQGIIQ